MSSGQARRRGRVVAFDVESGLGVIESTDGSTNNFHCIEIADGGRDIAIGTEVSYALLAKFGRYEASDIRP